MKAVIKKHRRGNKTGMIYLGDRDRKISRNKAFPVGSEVELQEAHFFGKIKVYRAYLTNGRMDYFDQSELTII